MILPGVFLFAVVLRLAMWLSPKSLWGDEWFSIGLAVRPLKEVFLGSLHDVHPPLYFLTLHGLIRCFGESELVFRSVSFLSGALTVAVVYLIARDVFGDRSAMGALFLTAVSPYCLQSSNEIRGYALLGLAASMTIFFFIRALNDPGRFLWRAGYVFSSVLSIYVEHYAWFVVWATAGALFCENIAGRPRKELWRALGLILAAGTASLALIGYQAVFGEHMFEGYRLREYLFAAVLVKKAVGILWHFTNGYYFSMLTVEKIELHLRHTPFFWVSAASAVTAGVLVLRALKDLFFKNRSVFTLASIVLLFPTLNLLFFYPIRLNARYLSFASPFFFVLLGGGLETLRKKSVKILALALLSGTAVFGSLHAISLKTDPAHKEDYRGLITYVFSKAGEGDVVCGLSGQVRYYGKQLVSKSRAIVAPELADLSPEVTRSARRVWVLDQLNMHDHVWRRNYEQIKVLLERLGFVPAQEPYRYGGEEGLIVLYLFERR